MKKIILLSVLSAIAIGSANAKPKVIATYSGGKVTDAQISEKLAEIAKMRPDMQGKKFADLDSKIQEALLYGYINDKIVNIEANKSGISSTKEFKERLDNFAKQMLLREFMEKIVKSKVTDAMVDEKYKELVDSLKNEKEVKVSHILVEDEKAAKDLRKQLSRGKDFAELARVHSKDTATKISGGELGYFTKGQMVEEFESKAFSMKKDQISEPVKTQFGWHIIKLLDKRAARVPSKDEARQAIYGQLGAEAVEKYVDELRKKYNVEIKLNNK